MSGLSVILFLGGWLPPFNLELLNFLPGYFWFGLKTILIVCFFVLVRAAYPRYRYDQLMRLG
jgi:NADH-quinone oxidoreductase subunit H